MPPPETTSRTAHGPSPRAALLRAFLLIGAIPLILALGSTAAQRSGEGQEPDRPRGEREGDDARDAVEGELSDPVQRGRYIVHDVAMCVYCHTPRHDDGRLNRQRLLQGAPMPVRSPFPGQEWCFTAPKLAGLPGGWSEPDLVRFLQTGETPRGPAVRPPMPPFRMTERDAAAVATYLKSLR